MNAVLLTILAFGGADAAIFGGGGGGGVYGSECDDGSGGGRHGHHRDGGHGGWCGPMPQSCYNPSFGCYPSTPFMHRYPAFHGTYYRKAYNYRNYFDYPWHAGLHEPTSMFSFHVPGETPAEGVPVPVPAAASTAPRQLRTASAEGPSAGSPYKIQR